MLIVSVAAALRAWLPYGHVFDDGFTNVQTSDAWYRLRLLDSLSANFPHALRVDPYAASGGQGVPADGTFFEAVVALLARILGLGTPSPPVLEAVAVWLPVVLALATIGLTFLVGRRLFDASSGLVAAALLATMPGPFLESTLLGHVDHRAAEVFLSTLALCGLVWASQRAQDGWQGSALAGHRAVAVLDTLRRRAGWPPSPAAVIAGVAMAAAVASAFAGDARPSARLWDALRTWATFRTTFLLALSGVVILAGSGRRRRHPGRALLVLWMVVAVGATVARDSFGVHLAVVSALVAGWLTARLLTYAGVFGGHGRTRPAAAAAAVAAAVVLFYPSVGPSLAAARTDAGMPRAWRHAFEWLRTETPDPFGDPALYVARDRAPVPRPAYTVMNWWDHGYWLVRTARRVPVSNPTALGAEGAARFYTETDPDAAVRMLRELGVRYVTTGEEMPEWWFLAMPEWIDADPSRFIGMPYRRDATGTFTRTPVFLPEYYQSMISRLYLFGAAAATPVHSSSVVSSRPRFPAAGGRPYDEITDVQTYATYAEAEASLAALGVGSYRLAGLDPARTAVPLAALHDFRLAYESPERSAVFSGLPAVRVFELAPVN